MLIEGVKLTRVREHEFARAFHLLERNPKLGDHLIEAVLEVRLVSIAKLVKLELLSL